MRKGSNNTQIQVARISAYQAVFVALITAIAGVVTGYFARGSPKTSDPLRQHWLYIEEIRAEKDLSNARVRLTATVNGVQFSFPTKTLWASIGAHTGSFPLPLATDYTLSFGAFVLMHSDASENDLIEAESHRVETISGSGIPIDKRLYTLTLRKRPNVYSGDTDVIVVYSVR